MLDVQKMAYEEKYQMYMKMPHEELVKMKLEEEKALELTEEILSRLQDKSNQYTNKDYKQLENTFHYIDLFENEREVVVQGNATILRMKQEHDVLYKDDNIELREFDAVRLTNGLYATIRSKQFQNNIITNNTPIAIMTNPISSVASYCYLKHIVEVISHNDSFEEELEWWFKDDHVVNQPLYIQLDIED